MTDRERIKKVCISLIKSDGAECDSLISITCDDCPKLISEYCNDGVDNFESYSDCNERRKEAAIKVFAERYSKTELMEILL